MEKILLCEICREPIATFDPEELSLPINLQAFKSLYPERQVPDPFPPTLDDWRVAACPRCRRRPFLNFFEKGDGMVIVSSGDAVPEGGQWFVMVLGDSGLPEKMLLSEIHPAIPPEQPNEEAPPQELEVTVKNTPIPDLGIVITTTTVGPTDESGGQEPTGNYKSPPVTCPICGKKFRSAGRMAKYHTPCPSLPPQEGFKL